VKITCFDDVCNEKFDVIEVGKTYYIAKGNFKESNGKGGFRKAQQIDFDLNVSKYTVIQESKEQVQMISSIVPISDLVNQPTDISYDICGMLIENFLSGDKLSESIIGIGLNINQKLFSKDIPNPTSLILETYSEEKYDVKKELEIFAEIFSRQYAQIISADPEQLKANARYCQLLYRMGEEHRYIQTDYYTEGTPGEIVGTIVGIEEKTARLILQLDNGQLRKYFFKEIAYII
jgi:hypothetical protein